jgi:hypothetical protein
MKRLIALIRREPARLDVAPHLSFYDMPNAGDRDAVSLSNLPKRDSLGSKLANISDSVFGEHRPRVGLASQYLVRVAPCPVSVTARHAPFTDGVLNIVTTGPKKQVRRIHTRRVIAPVADEQPIRDRSVSKLPGVPVCRDGSVGWRKLAVSSAIAMSRPFPAVIRSSPNNFRPKSGFRSAARIAAPARTEALAIVSIRRKHVAASLASPYNTVVHWNNTPVDPGSDRFNGAGPVCLELA